MFAFILKGRFLTGLFLLCAGGSALFAEDLTKYLLPRRQIRPVPRQSGWESNLRFAPLAEIAYTDASEGNYLSRLRVIRTEAILRAAHCTSRYGVFGSLSMGGEELSLDWYSSSAEDLFRIRRRGGLRTWGMAGLWLGNPDTGPHLAAGILREVNRDSTAYDGAGHAGLTPFLGSPQNGGFLQMSYAGAPVKPSVTIRKQPLLFGSMDLMSSGGSRTFTAAGAVRSIDIAADWHVRGWQGRVGFGGHRVQSADGHTKPSRLPLLLSGDGGTLTADLHRGELSLSADLGRADGSLAGFAGAADENPAFLESGRWQAQKMVLKAEWTHEIPLTSVLRYTAAGLSSNDSAAVDLFAFSSWTLLSPQKYRFSQQDIQYRALSLREGVSLPHRSARRTHLSLDLTLHHLRASFLREKQTIVVLIPVYTGDTLIHAADELLLTGTAALSHSFTLGKLACTIALEHQIFPLWHRSCLPKSGNTETEMEGHKTIRAFGGMGLFLRIGRGLRAGE
ncbi:MAG: hypothetical protein ACQEQV_10755, partial [Fibrobacterota bacterium]